MRAMMCEAFGPPEQLKLSQVQRTVLRKGHVRIAVEAAGVNFPDALVIAGKYQMVPPLPFVPGGEVAGRIIELGDGVSQFKIGDPVIALLLHQGGYAEEVVVDVAAVMKRPDTMPADEGAGFSMVYGTSMHALKQRANLQPGETLLVLGAGGGVGPHCGGTGQSNGSKSHRRRQLRRKTRGRAQGPGRMSSSIIPRRLARKTQRNQWQSRCGRGGCMIPCGEKRPSSTGWNGRGTGHRLCGRGYPKNPGQSPTPQRQCYHRRFLGRFPHARARGRSRELLSAV